MLGKLKSGEENKNREAGLIKIYEITTQEDSKWAKYKILRAPLIIEPKIEVIRKCKWINCVNLLEKKIFEMARKYQNVQSDLKEFQ